MRSTLIGLILVLAGCVTQQDQQIKDAAQGNLTSLQLMEAELLELVPNGEPIDFSQVGGAGSSPVLYRPRDGWRILLRTYQLRAASLVAWSNGEKFDHAAGVEALVKPAIAQAKKNLPQPDDE
jgi:hypothetical protein